MSIYGYRRPLTRKQIRAIYAKAKSKQMIAFNERKNAGHEAKETVKKAGEFVLDKVSGGGYSAAQIIVYGGKSLKNATNSFIHEYEAQRGFDKLRKDRERRR